MHSFDTLNLPLPLKEALLDLHFTTPTPIQAVAIPHALEGKDILGTAQTGTGKTGAFGIPLITKLLTNPRGSALVMTPTRELAAQVMKMLRLFLGRQKNISTALLIGGDPMPKQCAQLRTHPRLIVGTPGRINDHLRRKTLTLDDVNFLVLDETDRMLDMGFGIQIDEVLSHMSKKPQTLLFSATMPGNIVKLSAKYLKDPERISMGSTTTPNASVSQENIEISEVEKYDHLLAQLDKREGSIIVFVKTKFGADRMAKKLRALKHDVHAIHGGLRQNRRDKVIAAFRNKGCRIMVATDIAARGLDIPHIEHVINYDLPQCPEDYIHRIGRTGRAGSIGAAANLITPQDRKNWQAICRLLDPEKYTKSNASNAPSRSYTPRNKKPGGRRFKQRRSFSPHASFS